MRTQKRPILFRAPPGSPFFNVIFVWVLARGGLHFDDYVAGRQSQKLNLNSGQVDLTKMGKSDRHQKQSSSSATAVTFSAEW